MAYGSDFISFGGRTLPGDEVACDEERLRIALGHPFDAMDSLDLRNALCRALLQGMVLMTEMKNYGEWPIDWAVPFVKEWEGFRAKAYQCTSGIWTIGYGHTADVEPDDVVTNYEAEDWLRQDLQFTADRLAPYINVRVTKGQFIALTSLAFNIGVRGLVGKCPKLMHALNTGEYEECAKQFLDITNGGVPGLVRRRKAEVSLFLGE